MAEQETTTEESSNDKSMGFMSHLIELRDRLLRIVLAVLLIFLSLFYWANDIYTYLAGPLTRHLPEGSQMIAEVDTDFDLTEHIPSIEWDVRTYPPAFIGVARK